MFEIVIVYYISNLCIACYQQDNSSDEEETVLNDFPPFMANFRKPKINITAEDKKDWLESGMDLCKTNELLQFIIREVFDFEKEESTIANEIFAVPEKMSAMFDYMDLFFQTQPISNEESFKKAAALMLKLRKYYDKKACLNTKHTESIIDVFRF